MFTLEKKQFFRALDIFRWNESRLNNMVKDSDKLVNSPGIPWWVGMGRGQMNTQCGPDRRRAWDSKGEEVKTSKKRFNLAKLEMNALCVYQNYICMNLWIFSYHNTFSVWCFHIYLHIYLPTVLFAAVIVCSYSISISMYIYVYIIVYSYSISISMYIFTAFLYHYLNGCL